MSTRPNVLLVTVDQWPGHLLGSAGHEAIETPTLDTLAQAGMRYNAMYSECPICIPARRTLMTGLTPRGHGDRVFRPDMPMPERPTLASIFRDAGYQASAVGKLHVHPQRDRIGFDDTILAEEGRPQLGAVDDYDIFLADRGHAGRGYLHGMSNNDYNWRFWHLEEKCHVTNWAAEQMARTIKRRDPTRPALWHLSFNHPHPPLVPLASYFERYARREMDIPVKGDWAEDAEALPHALKLVQRFWPALAGDRMADVRRAFYALCTHIDHQLRVVIGTLREEGVLDSTAILILSDHGDMLGDHGLWAKRLLYDGSARVPAILVPPRGDLDSRAGATDGRLCGLADVLPTLAEIAGVATPAGIEGLSMAGSTTRDALYAEAMEDAKATRMIRDDRHKLIWYPAGNHVQLFDMQADPRECRDLAATPELAQTRRRLEDRLVSCLYGGDLEWVRDGRLMGFAPPDMPPPDNRGLSGQRGLHYPQPPADDPSRVVGTI